MHTSAVRTIVAGVATPGAEDATLLDAAALARQTGADLHLVHAFDPPALGALVPDLHSVYLHADDGREARLRRQLREAMAAVAPGVAFSVWVYPDAPGDAILEVARKVGADLVVVGASHHGALGRAVLGTAAERVVRGSSAPVLVLREPFLRPLRRVLLTTDLSDLSARVHEAGLDMVDALFAGDAPEVRSLAVVTEGLVPPPLPRDTLLHEAAMQLEEFLALRSPRGAPVCPSVRAGDPADEIAEAAAELDADLLVMGTHARHGVRRLVLGSVAESVLDGAPCNVLVFPPAVAAVLVESESESEPEMVSAG